MPLYYYEFKLSEKGLFNIKEIPSTIDLYREGLEEIGGKVVGQYSVFGENCFVLIAEFPDDETAEIWNSIYPEDPAQALWETTFKVKRIFSLDEFKDIVIKLP